MAAFTLTGQEALCLMYRPWVDESSPVFLKEVDDEVYKEVPLLRQMLRLLSILNETGGVKLTAIGNLPGAVVRELYPLGVPEWAVEKFYKSLNSEDKALNVQLAKSVLIHLRYVRPFKGKLVITKKGQAFADKPRDLLQNAMSALCTNFNMGFFDRMDKMPPISWGSSLIYILLSKYGDEFREIGFYKDEYKQFFQDDWSAFDDLHGDHREFNSLTSCMKCRIFERHLEQLGLVELKPCSFANNSATEVKRTPLFDKLIGISLVFDQSFNR